MTTPPFPTFRYFFLNPQEADGILAENIKPDVLSDGQLLIGSTGQQPVPSTLTPGSGIEIQNMPGSVTVSNKSDIYWIHSLSDVSITSQSSVPLMSVTVPAGDYFVNFHSEALANAGSTKRFWAKITLNGVDVSHSIRRVDIPAGDHGTLSSQAVMLSAPQSSVIEVLWSVESGTGTLRHRLLSALRIK